VRIGLVHANDGSDIRVGKVCRSFTRMGFQVDFIGWDRRPEERKSIDLGDAGQHILTFATAYGKSTVRGQASFLWHILSTLAAVRPDIVYAVNEENALLALAGKKLLYRKLICDVFDSLVDRHSRRPLLGWFLGLIALISRWSADRLIATDEARYRRFGRFRDKCTVIENYPESCPAVEKTPVPCGPTKIWVGGTLTRSRGIGAILQAVESLEGVVLLSAGWPYDEFAAKTFVTHPKVDYRGIVTADEALSLASQCDAVFAFYAPTSVNNVYASPNKIYDAMCVGRPVIINEEILVADFVREQDLGMTCRYEDTVALGHIVAGLKSRRDDLAAFAQRTRALFQSRYSWERMEPRLRKLIVELSDRTP